MKLKIFTAPAIEPVSLQDIKEHLRLDSGSFNDNLGPVQSILPGSHAIADEYTTHAGAYADVLGYSAVAILDAGAFTVGTVDARIEESDVSGSGYLPWTGGAFVQVADDGMTTTPALAIGTTKSLVANGAFTYYISGVAYSKAAVPVGTAPGNDVIPQNKFGAVAFDIDAAGTITTAEAPGNGAGTYATATAAVSALPTRGATLARMGYVTAKSTAVAGFTFGTDLLDAAGSTVAYTSMLNVTDNAIYKIAYTGSKQYIKVTAKVLGFACEFGVQVVRYASDTTEDTELAEKITEAREDVEAITQRQIITATWDAFLDAFPDKPFIKLPFGNLQDVTSVEYTDSDGTAHPMAETTDYLVDTDSEPGQIVLPYGASWPSATLYPVNPIAIRFVCGYGDTAADVKAGIKSAIKMLAEDKFNNRSATHDKPVGTVTENKAVMNTLWKFRLWEF